MIDTTDILFAISIAVFIYWITGHNTFWTSIILFVVSILWGTTITYYTKNKDVR